jgi:cytochrome c oxidase subunit IV
MNNPNVSPGTYLWTYLALLALLGLTIWTSSADLGRLNLVISLGIAAAKALLILLFFMHLKPAGGLLRLAAALGAAWLAVLIGLVLADYATRGL